MLVLWRRIRRGVAVTVTVALLLFATPLSASASFNTIPAQDQWNNCVGCVSLSWEETLNTGNPMSFLVESPLGSHGGGLGITVWASGFIIPNPLIDHRFGIIYTCSTWTAAQLLAGGTYDALRTNVAWGNVHSSAYWATHNSEFFPIPCGNSNGTDRTHYLGLVERNWNSSFDNEPSSLHVVLSVGNSGDCPYNGAFRSCQGRAFWGQAPGSTGSMGILGAGKEATGKLVAADGRGFAEQNAFTPPVTFGCSATTGSCGDYIDVQYDASGCGVSPPSDPTPTKGFFPPDGQNVRIVADKRVTAIANGTPWPQPDAALVDHPTWFDDKNLSDVILPAGSVGVHRFRLFDYDQNGFQHLDTFLNFEGGGGHASNHSFSLYCYIYTPNCYPPINPNTDPSQIGLNECWQLLATADWSGVAENMFAASCGFDAHNPATWGNQAQCQAVVELQKANVSLRGIAEGLSNLQVTCSNCAGGGGGGSYTDPVSTANCTSVVSVLCIFKSILDAISGLATLFTTLFVPSQASFTAINSLVDTFKAKPPGSLVVGTAAGMTTAVGTLSSNSCSSLPALNFGSTGPLHGTVVNYPGMCAGSAGLASAPAFRAAYDLVRIGFYALVVFALWRMAAAAFGGRAVSES